MSTKCRMIEREIVMFEAPEPDIAPLIAESKCRIEQVRNMMVQLASVSRGSGAHRLSNSFIGLLNEAIQQLDHIELLRAEAISPMRQ